MNLSLSRELAAKYRSNTQVARVLTEAWVADQMFCPRCGNSSIERFPNNRPVADFYCPICKYEYELKSKNGTLARKVIDGAYAAMIERITGNKNPDFLFMGYDAKNFIVRDLLLIPKHFFVPEVIEQRKPLSATARRAGWIGCNILIEKIPEQGRIPIVKSGVIMNASSVIKKVNRGKTLEISDINARGWLMDVLSCLNRTPDVNFSLTEMYSFEDYLKRRHPSNNNIKPKIRQQLQLLRDKGFIEFLGNGKYRKI